ncbi:hypothetical protein ACFY36_07210 [Actinoplanes sp. NPDC000266]
MSRWAVAMFRAAAAVIGAALDRRTPHGTTADPADQQQWVLRNRSVVPVSRRTPHRPRGGPRRRRRHGGYGSAGAEI